MGGGGTQLFASAAGLVAAEGGRFPYIPVLIAIPVVAALLIAVLPSRRSDSARVVAVGASLLTAVLTIALLVDFRTGVAGYQFEVQTPWISQWGASWHFGIDGISLWLVVLTGVLFPIALLGSRPGHDSKAYHAWMMVLLAGSFGVFCALDLLVFFAFFEIVLVPMYFLIGLWGHGNRRYAAIKFFLYTMVGSALMLVGLLALVFLNQKATGRMTFDLVELANSNSLSTNAGRWIFASFALAFAVKVPLFPLHTWLPDAHTEAPTAGSVILAGIMLKLGTYGLVRFGLYLFPEAARFFAPTLLTLGVIGIIYGAVVATMQQDLKRLVAYSSVAHLGFIVVGTFALNTQGIEGGLLQMVNHGISTPALFLLVGWIYERRHTREIAALSGLQAAAPVFAGVFTLVMLSSIGVPGLNGFVGEFLVLLGAWQTHRWWAVVAASGVILAALYMLWAYQRTFHGPAEGENAKMADLKWSEGLVIAPLCILIVVLGLWPRPLIERMEPSVKALVTRLEETGGVKLPPTPGISEAETSGETHGATNGEGG